MRITDASFEVLKSALRRGRTQSPETLQLIEAIDGLERGKAKAIIVEAGETAAKVRARLMYAAKASNTKLDVAVKDDRVIFARKPQRGRPKSS